MTDKNVFKIVGLIFLGVGILLLGGTRGRRFAGSHSKPRKLPESAATPIRRVRALLGSFEPTKMISGRNHANIQHLRVHFPQYF